MSSATFKKEDLKSLVDGEECEALESIEDRIIGTSRWSITHSMVFRDKTTGKFYGTGYSRGATEQQDERPFEYEADLIECEEVYPVKKTITAYERTPAESSSP